MARLGRRQPARPERRDSLRIRQLAPTVYTMTASAATFNLTGNDAILNTKRNLTASAATFNLTGNDSVLNWKRTMTASVGTFTLTGNATAFNTKRNLTASAGTFTLTGNAAVLNRRYTMTGGGPTITLTGADISAVNGIYTYSGFWTGALPYWNIAGSTVNISSVMKFGSTWRVYDSGGTIVYTASGGDWPWQASFFGGVTPPTATATGGTFSMVGRDAVLNWKRTMTAATGAFTLTGNAATLSYIPVGTNTYTMTAASGAFTLTGNAAVLNRRLTMTGANGSFTLTGRDAALTSKRNLTAAKGTFTLTGNAAGLLRGYRMAADSASYVLTGNVGVFRKALRLVAASGSFVLTGNAASLIASGSPTIPEQVRRALFTALDVSAVKNYAVSGIYYMIVPEDVSTPYVIYQLSAPGEIRYGMGGAHQLEDDIWLIKAVTTKDDNALYSAQELGELILEAAESQLDETMPLAVDTIRRVARVQDIPTFTETVNDRTVYHQGFLLRVAVE